MDTHTHQFFFFFMHFCLGDIFTSFPPRMEACSALVGIGRGLCRYLTDASTLRAQKTVSVGGRNDDGSGSSGGGGE